jgi:CRP-like cAMP-binding protein
MLRMIAKSEIRPLAFGEYLFKEGEICDAIFVVITGVFQVQKSLPPPKSERKDTAIRNFYDLAVVGRGQIIGHDDHAQKREVRSTSVFCNSSYGEAYVLTKPILRKLMEDSRFQENLRDTSGISVQHREEQVTLLEEMKPKIAVFEQSTGLPAIPQRQRQHLETYRRWKNVLPSVERYKHEYSYDIIETINKERFGNDSPREVFTPEFRLAEREIRRIKRMIGEPVHVNKHPPWRNLDMKRNSTIVEGLQRNESFRLPHQRSHSNRQFGENARARKIRKPMATLNPITIMKPNTSIVLKTFTELYEKEYL